jgi:hypothetical protein
MPNMKVQYFVTYLMWVSPLRIFRERALLSQADSTLKGKLEDERTKKRELKKKP